MPSEEVAIGEVATPADPTYPPALVRSAAPRSAVELADAVGTLEARLAATPRRAKPIEHATAAYRLGLAYAEAPGGDRSEKLRRAISCYELAASIFDPRFDPVEHARTLNASGAARRALGDLPGAAELFGRAAELFEGRDRDEELAAALNNLGLARTELGEAIPALEAYDQAASLFNPESADGRRGLALTLYNRGQAFAASGTEEGLSDAMEDFSLALDQIDPAENAYHYALIHQGRGIVAFSLAGLDAERRGACLEQAVSAFEEALGVFSRTAFPFQHALTKYNLGLAWSALAGSAPVGSAPVGSAPVGVVERRVSLACFEDVVSVLDPRVHPGPWKRAYASLARVEAELAADFPGWGLADHFVALLSCVTATERADLLRERVTRLLALPDAARDAALIELDASAYKLVTLAARAVIASQLSAVMELPNDAQEAVVRALMDARNLLGQEGKDAADLVLDGAVGDALDGPQRILVRDFMYSMGFVRP